MKVRESIFWDLLKLKEEANGVETRLHQKEKGSFLWWMFPLSVSPRRQVWLPDIQPMAPASVCGYFGVERASGDSGELFRCTRCTRIRGAEPGKSEQRCGAGAPGDAACPSCLWLSSCLLCPLRRCLSIAGRSLSVFVSADCLLSLKVQNKQHLLKLTHRLPAEFHFDAHGSLLRSE